MKFEDSHKTSRILGICNKGTGVETVHKQLQQNIENYSLETINRYKAILPTAIRQYSEGNVDIIHTIPELAAGINGNNPATVITTFHLFSLDLAFTKYASRSQSIYYRNILSKIYSKSISKSKIITAVSKKTAAEVRNHFSLKEHPTVIYNGVDINKFKPSDTQRSELPIILFSGNPSRRKGIEMLSRVAEELDGIAKIWCTGGLRNNRKIPNHKNLHFLGAIPHDEMPEIYNACDILFLPSIREGCSMAILEAMASGISVVSTNTSSMPELIEHSKGGYLYDPDIPSEAVKSLKTLAKSNSIRNQFGSYNRERVEKQFSITKTLKCYQELFKL